MASGTIGIIAICFVSLVSGYYPVIHTKKPLHLPPKKLSGCYAPQFKDGSYAPEVPSGFCKFGTIIHFKCKAGYKLDGPKQAQCKPTGHWYPPHIPICKKLDKCKMYNPCGPNAKCVDYQGQLKCVCLPGYVAKGKKCIAMTCSIPKLGKYCQYKPKYQQKWFPGQKIQYVCPPGYELVGPQYGKCLHGGIWDNKSPICKKRVYCKVPSLPYYCTYTPRYQRSWGYGHKIYFHCPDGFKKVGAEYATCSHGGKWDAYPPKCERPKLCDLPTLPQHCGYSPPQKHHWDVGTKIHFHCPPGYNKVGSDYATCVDHGVWDAHPPVCNKPKLCPPPNSKSCAYKPNYVAWHVGQKVTFYSPKGYKIIGHPEATCQKDGTWDHYAPECPPPPKCCLPKLDGGVSLYQQYGYKKCWSVGEKVQFKCPYGYYLKGDEYAKCLYGGHWSNKPPVCIKKVVVVCYLPKLKDHCGYGPYNKQSWNKGEKIMFHCPKGYELKGNDYAICTDHGKWSHDTPYCYKRPVCYVPHMTKYLSINDPYHLKYFEVGHKMKFMCPKGYYLKGNQYAVCLPGGKWDKPTPICVRIVCHAPVLTPYCDYQPKYKASWYPGQKVKFYCPYGYNLVGQSYASCNYDGKWSNPAPICKKAPVYCKAPPLPPTCHCEMSTNYKTYYNVGEMARFSCQYGYILKGYEIAKCMYNGHWSHPTPVCIKKPQPVKYGYGLFPKFW